MNIEQKKEEFLNLLISAYRAAKDIPVVNLGNEPDADRRVYIATSTLKQYGFDNESFWDIICPNLKIDGYLKKFENPILFESSNPYYHSRNYYHRFTLDQRFIESILKDERTKNINSRLRDFEIDTDHKKLYCKSTDAYSSSLTNAQMRMLRLFFENKSVDPICTKTKMEKAFPNPNSFTSTLSRLSNSISEMAFIDRKYSENDARTIAKYIIKRLPSK